MIWYRPLKAHTKLMEVKNMGGAGDYYDRDVTDRTLRTSAGFSTTAEERLSASQLSPALDPCNRRIACESKSPFVFAFDVTGSMGNLPKIIYDKMPMIAGQIIEQGYVEDPIVSLAGIGDILSDRAPIQISDFAQIRNIDEWLERIYLEGGGGGQAKESYELVMYFYARNCDMKNAETPFLIITGDEGFRENLFAADLQAKFGGAHENVNSQTIFDELKTKFKGNVFLIHRYYSSSPDEDSRIVIQWENALGKENVIRLSDDSAIADTMLGLIAIVTGSRTLDEYLEDMKNREQTPERIDGVEGSLEFLASKLKVPKKAVPKTPAKKKTPSKKTEKTKPGRI